MEIEKRKEEFINNDLNKLFDLLGEPTPEEIKEVIKRSRKRRLS